MGHQLARNPRKVLRGHHIVLWGRPKAPRMEAFEGTPRFAQADHLPSCFWQQNASAALASASSDFRQIRTNFWPHGYKRIPLMINSK